MTGLQAYQILVRELEKISDSPSFEAFEIMNYCSGFTRSQVLNGLRELKDAHIEEIDAVLKRRLLGEPLQYIFGEWMFYNRPFAVGKGVLIPRADTEVLVEAAVNTLRNVTDPKIADLCAGSGCVGVSVSLELPGAKVDAFEKSEEAFYYLNRNIELNSAPVNAILWDVTKAPINKYDMIVSNPPYLTKEDMENLQKEVTFEPEMALYGGEDGLDFYRAITAEWKFNLKKSGWLFYEVGAGQDEAVAAILEENGFTDICTHKDLCGIIRVVGGKR